MRAIIGLGASLDLPVLAEGVETERQLAFLAAERCDEVQGYLLGRPAPIAQYRAVVEGKGGGTALAEDGSPPQVQRAG